MYSRSEIYEKENDEDDGQLEFALGKIGADVEVIAYLFPELNLFWKQAALFWEPRW